MGFSILQTAEPMSMQCLIIDDDPDDQEIFLMCVAEVDPAIACLTSDSGVQAIAMLQSDTTYTPDFIFIDVNMPKMNGITCLGVLKKIERLQKSSFFMYSTTSDRTTLRSSKELGADDFIIKPTKTSELKEKLKKIFSNQNDTIYNKTADEI